MFTNVTSSSSSSLNVFFRRSIYRNNNWQMYKLALSAHTMPMEVTRNIITIYRYATTFILFLPPMTSQHPILNINNEWICLSFMDIFNYSYLINMDDLLQTRTITSSGKWIFPTKFIFMVCIFRYEVLKGCMKIFGRILFILGLFTWPVVMVLQWARSSLFILYFWAF